MNISVSNLSFQAMDHDVRKLFSAFGEVKSAKVVMDDYTKRSRGFALVEMDNAQGANEAIQKLHNTIFMNKTIIVEEKRTR